MGTGQATLPDMTNDRAGLKLPSNVREVVIYLWEGGTGLYVCTTNSCDQYVLTPTSRGCMSVVRVANGVGVPSTSGKKPQAP